MLWYNNPEAVRVISATVWCQDEQRRRRSMLRLVDGRGER
jgi:hypothetical protein